MHVAVFHRDEVAQGEANKFIDSVNIYQDRVEIHDGFLYVFYEPILPLEGFERKEAEKRVRAAEEKLITFRQHRAFLGVVEIGDEDKLEQSRRDAEQEVRNNEAVIELFKAWEPPKTS